MSGNTGTIAPACPRLCGRPKASGRGYCRPCENELGRDRNRRDPRAVQNRNLKYAYGITVDEYEELLEAQHGVCALCERACPTGQRLAVDHDHETGRVRGLLCRPCNSAVAIVDGVGGDWLRRAEGYLDA